MGISLKIKGNKHSNEGIGIDHVAIGDSAFRVDDRQYHPVTQADDVIVLRHYSDKSVYSMVTTNVSSVDGSRAGTLIVSVCVPVGERVEQLFNLLLELSNYYKANYMTYDGARYRFTGRQEVVAEFEGIMRSHRVTQYRYRPVVSDSDESKIAYIYMSSSDIARVLEDPMRDEFAKFGSIVFVPKGNPADSTISLGLVQERPYTLTVNGRKVSTVVTDQDKVLNISVPETDKLQGASVRFTINEARESNVAGASVIVDDFNQTLTVNVHQRPKPEPIPVRRGAESGDKHRPGGLSQTRIILIIVAAILLVFGASVLFGLIPLNGSADNEPDNYLHHRDTIDEIMAKEEYIEAHDLENDMLDGEEIGGIVGHEDFDEDVEAIEKVDDETYYRALYERQRERERLNYEDNRDTRAVEVEQAPVQDDAITEAYSNYIEKLKNPKKMTVGEYKEIGQFVENSDLTRTQKNNLLNELKVHIAVHDAFGEIDKGVGVVRDRLGAIKTNNTNVREYINNIVKLDDEGFEKIVREYNNRMKKTKTDNQKLY